MGMKFAFLSGVVTLLALGLSGCSTSSTTTAGSGILYVTAQGNPTASGVSIYGIDLATGLLNNPNIGAKTGNMPGPIALSPSGAALFVANLQDNTISAYTVNTDGSLTAVSGATATAATPMGMAIDPAGKFLYVANQGTFADPTSGSISVFSISGTMLTAVAGSPFLTEAPGDAFGTGPVSLAISPNGNYLYVANQFANTVTAFQVSSGVLTQIGTAAPVGTAPSGVTMSPDGNFLFVANTGSNNVSVLAACTNMTITCPNPDGSLKNSVVGSPFSAGLGPVALIAVSSIPGDEFLFVVDHNSNQVSQFKVAVGTGVLSVTSPLAVSTGAGPGAIAVRAGSGTTLADGGITNYVYVTNTTAGTISSFSYDTTQGGLAVVGGTVTTAGQPSGVAAR